MAEQIDGIKNEINSLSLGITEIFSSKKNQKGDTSKGQNHLLNQLNDISLKMNDLEKSIAVGMPLAQATEGLSKLQLLQDSVSNLDSKLTVYISESKELKGQMEDLTKLISDKVNKSQIDSISNKIDYLENLYSELAVSQTNDSLVALIEIIESLRSRIKQLEVVVEKEVMDYSFDDKKEGSSKILIDANNYSSSTDVDADLKELNKDSLSSISKEEPKKGFFKKIFGGFFSLFSKKDKRQEKKN